MLKSQQPLFGGDTKEPLHRNLLALPCPAPLRPPWLPPPPRTLPHSPSSSLGIPRNC